MFSFKKLQTLQMKCGQTASYPIPLQSTNEILKSPQKYLYFVILNHNWLFTSKYQMKLVELRGFIVPNRIHKDCNRIRPWDSLRNRRPSLFDHILKIGQLKSWINQKVIKFFSINPITYSLVYLPSLIWFSKLNFTLLTSPFVTVAGHSLMTVSFCRIATYGHSEYKQEDKSEKFDRHFGQKEQTD